MMKCNFDHFLLQEYLDGTIDPLEKIILEGHLKECVECRKELTALKLLMWELEDIDKVGIVGVACVLNLLDGGWKAKELGIPAQCVLLDACGCKKHWDQDGICTDINMEQLLERLDYTETEVIFHLS